MKTILDQADSLRRFALRKSKAHYLLAEKNIRKHTASGVLATLFSSIVDLIILMGIVKQANSNLSQKGPTMQIVAAFLSIVSAVLAGLQTFFKFSEISQQHKNAGAAYEGVRHRLDFFLLTYKDGTTQDAKNTALRDYR